LVPPLDSSYVQDDVAPLLVSDVEFEIGLLQVKHVIAKQLLKALGNVEVNVIPSQMGYDVSG
jgi:hypothetical protein